MRINIKSLGYAALAVVLMVLVGLISARFILPTGVFVAPWAGIIALAVLLAAGVGDALGVAIVSLVIMFLTGTADLVAIVAILLTVVILAWLVGWQLRDRTVTHQQLIFLGLIAGLLQLVLIEGCLAIAGLCFDGQGATALAYVRLGLSTSILTALLYAVLTPLLGLGARWLWRHWVAPVDSDNKE